MPDDDLRFSAAANVNHVKVEFMNRERANKTKILSQNEENKKNSLHEKKNLIFYHFEARVT